MVKQQMREILPDAEVFLDVDDMEFGRGAEYVESSAHVLIFCSKGYFDSLNCMRELLCAVTGGRPIVALIEVDRSHGGTTLDEIRASLRALEQPVGSHASRYASWGLDEEVRSWGATMPSAEELYAAILACDPIEWARNEAFQDVSMRLIAGRILPDADRAVGAYLNAELVHPLKSVKYHMPRHPFLVCCSASNVGAAELMAELERAAEVNIRLTTETGRCSFLVVYLNQKTWTSGDTSAAFASEVIKAMDEDVPILLAHEMPGLGEDERHGCEFDLFFTARDGATPMELLQRKIYEQIAVPLRAGKMRPVSLSLLAKKMDQVVQARMATLRTLRAGRSWRKPGRLFNLNEDAVLDVFKQNVADKQGRKSIADDVAAARAERHARLFEEKLVARLRRPSREPREPRRDDVRATTRLTGDVEMSGA